MPKITPMARLLVIQDWHWHGTNNPDTCPDAECSLCSILCCPDGDILHFHHDGCPSCVARINAEVTN